MTPKETAVEWLESVIQAMDENGGDLGEDYPALLEHIKKAKEKEFAQRVDDYTNGYIHRGSNRYQPPN